MKNTTIFCRDAIRVIEAVDCEDVLHYCDPPYFNSDCGHYSGYSEEDFIALLDCLSAVKGKFVLSSYPSEVLTWNYKEEGRQQELVLE